jgi:hypothetical protein
MSKKGAKGEVIWTPHPGSQVLFLTCPVYEVLLSGARGSGKTECLLIDFAKDVGKGYGANWLGVLFRQSFPQLKDVIRKSMRLFPRMFPGCTFNKNELTWTFPQGEELSFRFINDPNDYWNYHGWEIPWQGFEELTNWPTDECYEAMKTCCRTSVPGIPKRIRATTNPYGRGHSWIKRYFIDATPPTKPLIENNQARTWIDSSVFENKTLIENDEHYLSTLQNIKDPNKKKAWLEGRWDIESGTMVGDIWEPKLHILPTFQIPKSWVVNRSFDWGYSHPFSLGYWAESDGTSVTIPNFMGKERTITFPRGTMFRVGELYGTNGEINTGLRCTPQQVGRMIWKKDYSMPHIKGCMIIPGPADNQIFDEQYDGKTLQASMLEAYKYAKFSKSNKHPHSRAIGSILIRQRLENSLKLAEQGFMEHPGLFIMDNCNHWRSIIPSLLRSELDPDDIMQDQEDHLWEETRYEVLSRIADTSKRTHTQGV